MKETQYEPMRRATLFLFGPPYSSPWLTPEACQGLARAGLFSPRLPLSDTEPDTPHFSLYDLIALTAVQQVLRCGISASRFRQALYDPSCFRCDEFPEEDLLFLSTGGVRGQELSRFLEVTHAETTILIRYALDGKADIEFVPNELLGAQDYHGVTLAGIECRNIRDLIESNIGSSSTLAPAQDDGADHPRIQNLAI